MDENRHTEDNSHSSASKHEDAVIKSMMQVFGDELLPLLGIHEKVISIAPTELQTFTRILIFLWKTARLNILSSRVQTSL